MDRDGDIAAVLDTGRLQVIGLYARGRVKIYNEPSENLLESALFAHGPNVARVAKITGVAVSKNNIAVTVSYPFAGAYSGIEEVSFERPRSAGGHWTRIGRDVTTNAWVVALTRFGTIFGTDLMAEQAAATASLPAFLTKAAGSAVESQDETYALDLIPTGADDTAITGYRKSGSVTETVATAVVYRSSLARQFSVGIAWGASGSYVVGDDRQTLTSTGHPVMFSHPGSTSRMGASAGVAFDVNEQGIAVGSEFSGSVSHAFVYDLKSADHKLYRLDSLIVSASRLHISEAFFIDSAGEILGLTLSSGGAKLALLTPTHQLSDCVKGNHAF